MLLHFYTKQISDFAKVHQSSFLCFLCVLCLFWKRLPTLRVTGKTVSNLLIYYRVKKYSIEEESLIASRFKVCIKPFVLQAKY